MAKKKKQATLGHRERQIMEIVYRLQRATVNDVLGELDDPPSYSSVRAMLGVLERKGLLKHTREKLTYVYMPTVPKDLARTDALRNLLKTFFNGSPMQAFAALLEHSTYDLSDEELRDMERMIREARKQGR
jgi:predicted transcriptional regulator